MARHGFVFTLNNPKPEVERGLRGCVGTCGVKYIVFGYEHAPTTGTYHLQGYLQANHDKKKRFSDALGIFVVPQKATAQQAADYCKKEPGYYESGEFDPNIKGTNEKKPGKRNDLDSIKEAIERGESYDDICTTHFSEAAKFGRFIKERIQARDTNKELDSLREAFASASLRPWQQALVDIVEEDPNPRAIHWIWEETGNTGKSWMTKYLAAMYKANVMTIGKKTDMAYLYSKNPSKVVVFDLSRTTEPGEGREHFLDGAYSLAEDLKNGMVTSYKYDSSNVLTTGCHVIFFANFAPDMTKWSADRYMIKHL